MGQKLKTFAVKARYGTCLSHEGGGVYDMLTEDKIVRMKNVRLFEDSVPRISIVGTETEAIEDFDDMDSMKAQVVDDADTSFYNPSNQQTPPQTEAGLTYTPVVKGIDSDCDEKFTDQEGLEDDNDYEVGDTDVEPDA